MKMKKWGVVLACGALVAALGLAGCSSNAGSSSSAASSSAQAESGYTLMEEGKLIVGTSPDFPPFENLENGEYVGFDIELAKALGQELGVEVEFKTMQFDGIVAAVAAGGQCDIAISGLTIDPERAKQVDFTDPYYIADQSVAVMKGGSITKDNADEALNVAGVVIAVQSGSTGEAYAQENYPNATIQPYGNATDCFAAMQSGQAVAVCMDKAVVENMVGGAYTDAEIIKNVATGEEYAVAVSQDNPELTKALNDAIAKLTDNGTINDLTARFLG